MLNDRQVHGLMRLARSRVPLMLPPGDFATSNATQARGFGLPSGFTVISFSYALLGRFSPAFASLAYTNARLRQV